MSAPGHIFDYTPNFNIAPSSAVNVHAARVNTFYVTNVLHDVWYLYGFTESAFNFQLNNFGKGGEDWDHVQISVQDNGGYNNAVFGTPPE